MFIHSTQYKLYNVDTHTHWPTWRSWYLHHCLTGLVMSGRHYMYRIICMNTKFNSHITQHMLVLSVVYIIQVCVQLRSDQWQIMLWTWTANKQWVSTSLNKQFDHELVCKNLLYIADGIVSSRFTLAVFCLMYDCTHPRTHAPAHTQTLT